MVERIIDRQSMIAWAKKAEQNGGIKEKCLRQDEWGRSQSKDIEEAYKALDSLELRAVSCAIFNVMGMDELWKLINIRGKWLAESYYQDMVTEFQEYQAKENEKLDSYRCDIDARVKAFALKEHELARLQNAEDVYKKRNVELHRMVQEYQGKADKYDQLKALLA